MRIGIAVVLGALLACGGIDDGDRAEQRSTCAKQGGLDAAASDAALAKLRAGACRTKLFYVSCEDFWDRVVTTCVHRLADGKQRIDVHTNIFVDTGDTRRLRSAICDHVRWDVSASDPAFVYGGQGRQLTTCGTPRRRKH